MRIVHAALLGISFLLPAPSFAEAEHGHDHAAHSHEPVSQDKAIESATDAVSQLVAKGKLETSWQGIKTAGAEKKQFDKNVEWVVTFNNPAASDKAKQNLYVFLTLTGGYITANFSGK